MAPEIALSATYNERVDIYSLGVILYEMSSGSSFFEDMRRAEFLRRVVEGQERPRLDFEGVGQEVVGLIKRCWHPDMSYRPSASSVLKTLEERRAEVDRSATETAVGAVMNLLFSQIY